MSRAARPRRALRGARRPTHAVAAPRRTEDALGYLRVRSHVLTEARGVRTIAVVSGRAEPRRSEAAAQLARALGQGRSCVLVDVGCALARHAADVELLGLAGRGFGLARGVVEGADLLLPRGGGPQDPRVWRAALEALVARYDYVVVDCPPLLDEPDAFIVRDAADALVLVAAAGRTRLDEVARTLDGRADRLLAVLLA